MCKLFAINKVSKIKNLEGLTRVIQSGMTSERDGFGIMAKTKQGSTSWRKFLNPKQATILPIQSSIFSKKNWTGQGSFEDIVSIVFHGRTSTNDVSLINTHPINKHGISLMHNGVVQYDGPKYQAITTNDTEHMVELIAKPNGLDLIQNHVTGYYATIDYREGIESMRIIKDNIAPLLFFWSDDFESYFFASTEAQLQSVAAFLKINVSIQEVEDSCHFEINSKNEVFNFKKITPKGRSKYADSWSSKSLGYELKDYSRNEDTSLESDFFLATDFMDHNWKVFYGRNEISQDEFFSLDVEDQKSCCLIDDRGVIYSCDENTNGKHWSEVLY